VSTHKLFKKCGFLRYAAFLLIASMLLIANAYGQVAGGTLSGTVSDPSGGSIPQGQVVIKNVATGIDTTVETNGDGYYTVPNLLPGEYRLTVTAKGFNTATSTGITMTVGGLRTVDVTMQIGTTTHVVEVTSAAPDVQVTSSEISATVNATTVRELPLNGRSWTDLAALQPGVSTIQTQPPFATGADRGNRGFGQQLTISGARPQQNNYRLDGVSLNDYANGAPGSVLGGNLGVDAIQEFSVLTTNYSAEYGKTSGGVVNAITRSGTNAFHGSAYEFVRNSALDAANFFEQGQRTPFQRNQFGGAIGGPIIKNKTFFFADYEGIRQEKGIPNSNTVPSADARNGLLYDANGALLFPQFTVNPEVQKYLALYPIPSCLPKQNQCAFTYSAKQVITENFVTFRIDHRFSDKDALFGTYVYDKTPYSSPDPYGNVQLGTLSARQIVAVEETHTFTPTFVNAVRFGYNHERVDNDASVSAINPAAADTSLGAFAGRNASVINVGGGLTSMTGGVGGLPTYLYRWNSFQGYDDAFWNHGKHTIKFGFAYERMLLQVTALTDPNGIWFFPGLHEFLTNQPNKFQGGIASSLTPRNLRQSIIAGYIQDDWRAKPYLTLNLGLRYEMSTVPYETDGKIANLRNISDPQPVCGSLAAGGCSGKGAFFSNPTLHNFEPRVGFAWDPLHNGKLAVRGGIGLYDVLPLPYQFILLTTQSAPFFQYTALKTTDPVPPPPTCPLGTMLTFPTVTPCLITSNKNRSTYVQSNPKRNYVTQWNLNMQYQLTPTIAAMVAYVGSRGVHQPYRVDEADLVIPTKDASTGRYYWPQVDNGGNEIGGPNAGNPPNPINTNFGSIRGMFYQGRSYYNALETQLAKRLSHGFQVQGTFTWGRSIDTSSATLAGDAFGNSISSLNWFDPKLSRGPSDYNVGKLFVLNGTWEIPPFKSLSGPAAWLANGWELGLIFTASDGVPFTPTWGTGSDPAGTLSSDDFAYPDRVPGCHSLVHPGNPNNYVNTDCFSVPIAPSLAFWTAHCDPFPPTAAAPIDPASLQCYNLRGNSGRNILTGPGITNLDFSIFKNIPIHRVSENFNVQLRVEMFNVLNHAMFAPPGPGDGNTDLFDSAGVSQKPTPTNGLIGGKLVRTTIPERQIQFAVKINF
jgi:hypothetical protein